MRCVGRGVTLLKGVGHSQGIPDCLQGRGSGQHPTAYALHAMKGSSFLAGFSAFPDTENINKFFPILLLIVPWEDRDF